MPARSGGSRFSIVQAWAVDDTRMSLSALRMLMLLGTYSNAEGWCWPSQAELSMRLGGVSQQFISKSIKELSDWGYLEIQYIPVEGGGAKKRARYKMLMDQPIPDKFNRQKIADREEAEREAAMDRTTPELYGEGRTTPELSGAQPPSSAAHNSPVVGNVPSLTYPSNVPTSSPRSASGAAGKEPPPLSKDGLTAKEWYDALCAGCYTRRGLDIPTHEKQEKIALNRLRLEWPVEVVIAYYDSLKAQPFWEERAVSMFRLAKDIKEWSGRKRAMKAWEAKQHGGSTDVAAGGASATGGQTGTDADLTPEELEIVEHLRREQLDQRAKRRAKSNLPPVQGGESSLAAD